MIKKNIILFVADLSFAEQYFGSLLSLISKNYHIVILHTSKLTSHRDRDSVYKNLDISFISSNKIESFISSLNPKVFLITNIRSLIDIYILQLCKTHSIRSVYIEHGLTLPKIVKFKNANALHSLLKYSFYVPKAISFSLRHNFFSTFQSFVKAMIKNDYTNYVLNGALLYTKTSKNIIARFFDIEKTKIIYSGYPIVYSADDLEKLKQIKPSRTIVYIHQPLIKDGFSKIPFSREIQVLKNINNTCKSLGYKFVIKLHPRDNYFEYADYLKDCYIEQKGVSVHELISGAEFVIGHFSTALLTAVLLRKPIIIIDQWELEKKLLSIFKPVSYKIDSVFALKEAILNYSVNQFAYDCFISDIVGLNNCIEQRAENLKRLFNQLS